MTSRANRRSRGRRPQARAELINELFADATTIIDACAGVDDDVLAEHVELLRIVAGQDIEVDGDGGVRIRQGVAPERTISTVDPDTRHGHRSRQDHYDGYKVHVSTDTESDLITAIDATTATTHDSTMLDDLLDTDPVPVAEVIADTHYGSAELRQRLADDGVELVAPPPPSSGGKGLFSKDDVHDRSRRGDSHLPRRANADPTSAARQTDPSAVHRLRRLPAARPMHHPAKGRVIEINPHEELLAHARAQRWTPEFRHRYRDAPVRNARSLRSSPAHRRSPGVASSRPEHGPNSAPARSTSTASDDSASSEPPTTPNRPLRRHPRATPTAPRPSTANTSHGSPDPAHPTNQPVTSRIKNPLPTSQLEIATSDQTCDAIPVTSLSGQASRVARSDATQGTQRGC